MDKEYRQIPRAEIRDGHWHVLQVHLQAKGNPKLADCSVRLHSNRLILTTNPMDVTCKRCLKRMGCP